MRNERIIREFLELQEAGSSRYRALLFLLKKYEIDFKIETCRGGRCRNIVLPLTDEKKYAALVAHYDVVPKSLGINDNLCSVALLIELAMDLKGKLKKPLNIVFTDLEESGMIGATSYARRHINNIDYALVFDIIGYGNQHFIGTHKNELYKRLEGLKTLVRINTVLPSDNVAIESSGLDTAIITAAHRDDIIESKTGIRYITRNAKFYESFHNRLFDNDIDVINFKLVEKLKVDLVNFYG